jgi:hypothetical protein
MRHIAAREGARVDKYGTSQLVQAYTSDATLLAFAELVCGRDPNARTLEDVWDISGMNPEGKTKIDAAAVPSPVVYTMTIDLAWPPNMSGARLKPFVYY